MAGDGKKNRRNKILPIDKWKRQFLVYKKKIILDVKMVKRQQLVTFLALI
jgi:hypothetical protein